MRYYWVCAFCMFVMSLCARAQDETTYGLKTGLNLSAFSASINSNGSMKPGFHFGFFMRAPLGSTNLFLRPELYFSSQGQKDEYYLPPSGPSIGSTRTIVNYINIPVLIEGGGRVTVQGGPQLGFLLSAREKGTVDGEEIDDDLKEIMKKVDLSLVLGLGYHPIEKIDIGLRYNLGLTQVFDFGEPPPGIEPPSIKNRVLHVYVAYVF